MYTVFIADDSDDLRTLLVRVFSRDPNFSVVGQAYDSDSTLTGVKQFSPHLLLLDLSMPGIGGVNIIKELRKSNPDLKIAVLSGLPSENLKEATIVAGANLYLEKGTPLKEILAKVLNVLK
jgi:DNA-binding NarL/FixJ family response regulator